MSGNDFKVLLKMLSKLGYGYPTDKLGFVINSMGYDTDSILGDMIKALGEDGAYKFIDKTLETLSDGDKGIKIDLKSHYDNDSWVYLKIKNYRIDLEETEECILINYEWGDSRIEHPEDGTVKTIEEIYNEVDMGDWSDWDQFISDVQDAASFQITRKTGLCFWWD